MNRKSTKMYFIEQITVVVVYGLPSQETNLARNFFDFGHGSDFVWSSLEYSTYVKHMLHCSVTLLPMTKPKSQVRLPPIDRARDPRMPDSSLTEHYT